MLSIVIGITRSVRVDFSNITLPEFSRWPHPWAIFKLHHSSGLYRLNFSDKLLYRAMDQNGNLVDTRLSKQRDMAAAKAFFAQAQDLAGQAPERVSSDGHPPYSRAIVEVLGPQVEHSQVSCRATPLEPDHRGVKQRYYPMLGFGDLKAAPRFCCAFEELRQFLRPRQRRGQFVLLAQRRTPVLKRVQELHSLFAPA